MENILFDYWFNPQIGYLRHLEAVLINNFLDNQENLQRPFLEVGCGSGRFTKELSLNIDEGTDISNNRIITATQNKVYKKCWQCSIENLPNNGINKYGLVIANSVLEHLSNPSLAIDALYKILKYNGVLLLTVPLKASENFSQFDYMPNKLKQEELTNSLRSFYKHITMQDSSWWLGLLEKQGFSIQTSKHYVFSSSKLILDALNPFNTKENNNYSFPSDEARLASQKTVAKMWNTLLTPYIEEELKLSETSNEGVNLFIVCKKK